MTDHVVIGASHPWLPRNASAIEQSIAFLRDGRFRAIMTAANRERDLPPSCGPPL